MDHRCHACGYDRSGDRSPVCPECGAKNTPPAKNSRPIGELLFAAGSCSVVWLWAFFAVVQHTYGKGMHVFRDLPLLQRLDSMVVRSGGVTFGAASSLIVFYLLLRRKDRVALWPRWLRWSIVAMLLIGVFVGGEAILDALGERSARR